MDLSANTCAHRTPRFTVMNGGASPISLNEISFYFTRAAVGAGAPFGLGEEFARASQWLACLDLDPARCAVPALRALADGTSSGALALHREQSAARLRSRDGRRLSAIHAGPVAADRLAIEAAGSGEYLLTLAETDQPVLVAAAVAAAEIDADRITVSWPSSAGERIVIELIDRTVRLAVADGIDLTASGPGNVDIALNRCAGTARPSSPAPHSEATPIEDGRQRAARLGVVVRDSAWIEVIRFFRKCLVPSTAQSRSSGAGAGSIDNA